MSAKKNVKNKKQATIKNKKKKGFFTRKYILFILLVSVILSALIIPRMIISINEGLLADITLFETDISELPNGVYRGSYDTSGYSASVDVTVISGGIAGIDVVSLSRLSPARASLVAGKVVKYQMINFDEPGWIPEPSDRVLLKAIQRALSGSAADL